MQFDPERVTFFAKTDARGQNVKFGIKAKDRTRHVYVIGKTGMGKSTLLENMAVQDIQNGEGLAFIDPHGQTAETILQYIPEHRKKDVLYFAPFDTAHPVAFNVMEDVGPERRHLVASGLMSVFKKIFVDAWSARMEYILTNTIMALLEYPDATLLGVNRMLSDKGYRNKVVDNIKDPAVKSFWVDEFANYNERYMQEAGDAIKNKIGQFTANPLIRNIIGQPKSSFDIRKIMDERKILIMNLSKGLVGESNANLLGSMLTTRIYLAAMSRADMSPTDMQAAPNFYFYVDEFQSFANATFSDILSEARKYKLNLTIAHQYIEQMEEEVRNAVFGNVGTTISFRVGPFDAEVLETIFAPRFMAVDIVNLGFAQVYLSLMIDGIGSKPFSAVTLPPIERPEVSFRDVAVAHSREQFTKTRAEVEVKINEWHEEQHPIGGGKKDKKPQQKFDKDASQNNPKYSKGSSNDNHLAPRKPRSESDFSRKDERNNSSRQDEKSNTTKQSDLNSRNTNSSKTPDIKDLRSVLASIAEPEKVVKSDPVKDRKTKGEYDKKGSESGASPLRSALARVLEQVPSSQTVDVKNGSSADASAPVATSASSTKVSSNLEEKKANHKDSLSGKENNASLDAKKIERMLRTHSSDSSPFK